MVMLRRLSSGQMDSGSGAAKITARCSGGGASRVCGRAQAVVHTRQSSAMVFRRRSSEAVRRRQSYGVGAEKS
jgi:hypothetical protein